MLAVVKNERPQPNDTDLGRAASLLGIAPEELIGGLNLVEAGRLLGISPSTLRSRALQGKIGCQRDGRAWRFFWWHLADYLADREHAADPNTTHGPKLCASQATRARAESDNVAAEAEALGLI